MSVGGGAPSNTQTALPIVQMTAADAIKVEIVNPSTAGTASFSSSAVTYTR